MHTYGFTLLLISIVASAPVDFAVELCTILVESRFLKNNSLVQASDVKAASHAGVCHSSVGLRWYLVRHRNPSFVPASF